MLNKNKNSDHSTQEEHSSQFQVSSASSNPRQPIRRIGTMTMGFSLILVGILLLIFFFHPFDLFSLMRFSPILLILLGIETIWQYFYHRGENLCYDFMGTFFMLIIIVIAGFFSILYPLYMEYGPASWKVEQQVAADIDNEIYQQLPETVPVSSLNVECEISSVTPDVRDLSADELTSADKVTLYFSLKSQKDLASFAQNVRLLLDTLPLDKYPNISIHIDSSYPNGNFSIWFPDRFSMRFTVEEIMQETNIENYGSDDDIDELEELIPGSSSQSN